MPPAADAHALLLARLWGYVINDVVRPLGIGADATRYMVEAQCERVRHAML